MESEEQNRSRKKLAILLSFAAVCIIWGSTYLAIKFALETIPPFFMAGSRFLIAGSILYLFSRLSGAPKPTLLHLKNASIIGTLLLVCGNGGVVYAEQIVPSGIAALVVAIEPVWVVLILWLTKVEKAPAWYVWLGLFLGMLGIFLLLGSDASEMSGMSTFGFMILLLSTFCWALGSIFAIKAAAPASSIMSTALQMLTGGFFLSLLSYFFGEWNKLNLLEASMSSILAVIYLILFGSIIGYSAYSYLTKNAPPSQVSTYAYINPVIAVLLGTFIGNETLTKQIIIATPILVVAVILLIWKKPVPDKN